MEGGVCVEGGGRGVCCEVCILRRGVCIEGMVCLLRR